MLKSDEIVIGLNTTFPLHIYNAPHEILQMIRDWFGNISMNREGWWYGLIPYLVKYDIRCREVDEYVCEFLPRFKEALDKDS